MKNLPSTSVIIIFRNEIWGLLLRCLHSVYNRTPKKILKEIILVDDASDDERLGEELKKYVQENFGDLVKIVVNPRRIGLIGTRMNGARVAEGEAIVFLDSHMEVSMRLARFPKIFTSFYFTGQCELAATIIGTNRFES